MNPEKNAECCVPARRGGVWLLFISLVLFALALYVTFRPMESYVDLSIVFGWIFIFIGISKIFVSMYRYSSSWGWYLAYGIISLALGVYLVAHIILTMEILPMIFAFWLLLQGCFIMSNAITMRPRSGWGWVFTGGILIVLVSFFLLFMPALSLMTLIIWTAIGLYIAAVIYFIMGVKAMKDKCHKE